MIKKPKPGENVVEQMIEDIHEWFKQREARRAADLFARLPHKSREPPK